MKNVFTKENAIVIIAIICAFAFMIGMCAGMHNTIRELRAENYKLSIENDALVLENIELEADYDNAVETLERVADMVETHVTTHKCTSLTK